MIRDFVRRHRATMMVALVAATVTAAAPAVGHGVEHALFAHDADRVDGKHAVGWGATVDDRKGKLVATNATTGQLPNNIIAKAPDAGKLDGIDSTGFTRGNNLILHGLRDLPPNPTYQGWEFVFGYDAGQPPPQGPWVGVYYWCPVNLRDPESIVFRNHGPESVNVFYDDGGPDAHWDRLFPGYGFARPAAWDGDHMTIQVEVNGAMATFEVFSAHRESWSACRVQGQAVFTY